MMRFCRSLGLVVAGAVAVTLLASCVKDRIEVVATFGAFPVKSMPDETLLASYDAGRGIVSDAYSISLNTGEQKHLGKIQIPFGIALDNNRWIVDSDANGNPEISIYDPTTKSYRLLVKQANLDRISVPVSPDKRKLLVKKNGVRVIDIATREETVLLDDVSILNAEWSPDGKSVVLVYSEPDKKRTLAERIEFPSKRHIPLKAAEARLYFPEVTRSSDRKYIAYERNGKVVCESLADGKKWIIVDLSPEDKHPRLIFSDDSERLGVSVYNDGNMNADLFVFDTVAKRVSSVRLGVSIAQLQWWDWLSDSRTIYVVAFAKNLRGCELWHVHVPPGRVAELLK